MRTPTAQEAELLKLGRYAVHLRASVHDGTSYVDLSTFGGFDWLVSAELNEDIDEPVASMTLRLHRAVYDTNAAPLDEDSPVNRNFVPTNAYNPLIHPARKVKLERAVVPELATPASGDWVLAFEGYIDRVSTGTDEVTLECSDLAAKIRDTYIEAERVYGVNATGGARVWEPSTSYALNELIFPATRNGRVYIVSTAGTSGATEPTWPTSGTVTNGTAVFTHVALEAASVDAQTIIQNLLDDNLGAGVVTLQVPVSPSFLIKPFKQDRTGLLEAIREVALQTGWDCRYKWSTGASQFMFTFYQPDRTKTVPDHTFGQSIDGTVTPYVALPSVNLGIESVRNAIQVVYSDTSDKDPAGVPKRKKYVATDSSSITKFGRRFMEIAESSASFVDTPTEAQRLAEAARDDLSTPKAEQEVETLAFPWAEVGDLYRYKANQVHYSADQDLAVTSFTHSFSPTSARTSFRVRGKPAGAYSLWHTLGVGAGSENESSQLTPPLTGVVTLTASAIPNGAQLKVAFDHVKISLWEAWEYHVSSSAGFTPSSSTLVADGKQYQVDVTTLTPGTTYYAKVVPLGRHQLTVIRGQPSAEVSFIAGYLKPRSMEPNVAWWYAPRNPDFEVQSDANYVSDGWTADAGAVYGTDYEISAAQARWGTKSLRMMSAGGDTKRILSELIQVREGDRVRAEVSVYGDATADWKMKLEVYSDAGTTVVDSKQRIGAGPGAIWADDCSDNILVGSTGKYARITLQRNGGTGSVYFDSVRLSFRNTWESRPVIAKHTTGLTVPTATFTKVTWDAEEFDPYRCFGSSRFTVPQGADGLYRVSSLVHVTDAGGKTGTIYLHVYKNGAFVHNLDVVSSAGAWDAGVSLGGSRLMELASGDYVEIYAYQNTGVSLNILANGDYSYFCIDRVVY